MKVYSLIKKSCKSLNSGFISLFSFFFCSLSSFSQQIVINEISQGATGSQEYVEFLVVGNPGCVTTLPCMDLRGYYIDDNNGFHASGSGVGIAQGSVRLSQDAVWSCVPIGTIIVIYNDADQNGAIPATDITLNDGNCALIVPISNCTLFERNTSLPSTISSTYPTTGFTSCGSWTPISMANSGDAFHIVAPSDLTSTAFAVGYGSNSLNNDIYFSSGMSGTVAYMANLVDDDPFNQANWTTGSATTIQTPGAPNNAANATWISSMNNNCQPLTLLSLGASTINATCTCNGSASVTASGAIPPYSYTWTPGGETTTSLSNLCAGSYTITVESSNGCIKDTTIIVNKPLPLTISTLVTNVSCTGSSDGSIAASGSGGIPVYSYSLNGGAQQMSGTFGALAEGNHILTFTDGNGCSKDTTITITANPIPSPPVAVNENRCGAGSVTLSVTGCSGGASTVKWYTAVTGGASVATGSSYTTPSISSTTTYYASCTQNGCESTRIPVTATINPAPVASASSTPPNCFGQCNAVLTGSVTSGGTSPFTFNWTGPNAYSAVGSNQTNACNGTYILTVTDINLCTATATTAITQPALLAFTASATPASCNGVCDGTLTANNATGGTGPYIYSWSGALGEGQNKTGVCDGSYTVTVTDSKLCTATDTLSVTQPVVPTVIVPANVTVCAGGIVAATSYTSTPAGGTFAWTNSNTAIGIAASGTGDISSFTATNTTTSPILATITVTPTVSGCPGTPSTYTITVNPIPNVNAGADDILTCEVTSLNLGGSSSTIGSTFNWTGGTITSGATSAIATVGGAGTYTLTVTANGCTATDDVVVIQNIISPNADAGADTNLTCLVTSLNLNGSSSTAGITYSWTGGTITSGANTATPTVTAAAIYTLVVTDPSNGCTATDNVIVSQNITAPNANAGSDEMLTCTVTSVVLSGSSTTAGVIYSWLGGSVVSGGNTATPTVDGVGTYTFTVTDPANGCTATDQATVSPSAGIPNVNAGADQTLTCTVTSLTLNGSSTTAGVTYNWSGPGIIADGTTATPTVNGAGTYTLTVTDPANGCSANDQAMVILNNTLPNASAGEDQALTCTVTSLNLAGSSTTAGVTYSWEGFGITAGGTIATPTVNEAGTYTLTVTNSNNGCVNTDEVEVSTNVSLPNVSAGADQILTCTVNSLNLEGSSTTPGVTYSWSGGNITAGGITASASVDSNATYILSVTDPSNGCVNTDDVVVSIDTVSPDANAGTDEVLTCLVTSLNLNGSSSVSGALFSWSGPGIVSENTSANPLINMAGTYVLTVANPTNGCVSSDEAEITSAGVPNLVVAIDNQVLCYGVCEGGFTAQASGTGGYEYSIDGVTYQASGTFINLCAGSYLINVKDSNGCITNAVAEISQPDELITTLVSQTDVSCSGGSDGEFTISASGGTQAYAYSNGGSFQSGSTFNLMTAGTSTVIVEDANGCQASLDVTIDEPAPLTISQVDVSDASCYGYSDGSVSVGASGGTLGYLYELISEGTTNNNGTFSGLAAGNYVIEVTDDKGCTVDIIVSIGEPARVVVTVTPSSDEICLGNGVSLTATGAVNYEWSPPDGLDQIIGADVEAIPAASITYTVTGTDLNGCSGDTTVMITVNPLPVITVAPLDPSTCEGGSVTLTASGAPDIQWTPADGTLSPGTNFPTVSASPNATTTYTAFGTSANGCVSSASTTVFVTGLPVVNAGPDIGICLGDNIELMASGTAINYDWYLSGALVGSGDNFNVSPLATTTYDLIGTDAGGCVNNSNVSVMVYSLPNVMAPNDQEICSGDSLTLTGSGAQNFEWLTGGAVLANTSSAAVSPTSDTEYILSGTDINGCKNFDSVIVYVNPLPVISINSPLETCEGQSATLTVEGALTYVWSPNINLSTTSGSMVSASPAASQVYYVEGTDINGCRNTVSSTLIVNQLPEIIITPENSTICLDSTLQLAAIGADSYLWSPGIGLSTTTENTVVFTPISEGQFSFEAIGTDNATGCQNSDTAYITVNPLPVANVISNVNQVCFGEPVFLSGNNADLNYMWSSADSKAGLNFFSGQNVSATPILDTSGAYNVTYDLWFEDVNGCVNTSGKTITVHPLPDVIASTMNDTICVDETANLFAGTATNNISYNWSALAGNPSGEAPSPSTGINTSVTLGVPSLGNFYDFRVVATTVPFGCIDSADVSIYVNDSLRVTGVADIYTICFGDTSNLNALSSGGNGGYSWEWSAQNSPSGLNLIDIQNPVSIPVITNVYTVTLKDNCGTPWVTDTIKINVNPLPVLNTVDDTICFGETGILKVSGADQYLWIQNDGILSSLNGEYLSVSPDETSEYLVWGTNTITGCSNLDSAVVLVNTNPTAHFVSSPEDAKIYNPIIWFNSEGSSDDVINWQWNFNNDGVSSNPNPYYAFADTGAYEVWLKVENEFGCVDSIKQDVYIKADYAIFFPNAFTPDDNELNDVFYPKGYGITEYEFLVFDRWGEMIFSVEKNMKRDWDGVFRDIDGWDGIRKGFTDICQQDVYVYLFKGKSVLGTQVAKTGHITLLR